MFHVGATSAYLNAINLDDRGFFKKLSELEDGYSINLANIGRYSQQPEGGLRTFNTSVYRSDDPDTKTTDE